MPSPAPTSPTRQDGGGRLRVGGHGPARSSRWAQADTLVAAGLGALLAVLFLATASSGPAQVNDTRTASVGAWSLGTHGAVLLPDGWPANHNSWGVEGRQDRVLVNRFPGVAYWASPAYAAANLVGNEPPPAHPVVVSPVPVSSTTRRSPCQNVPAAAEAVMVTAAPCAARPR